MSQHGLLYTRPIQLGPIQLVATDVPEDEHSNWYWASTYNLGERVIFDHKVWESLQDGNLNAQPDAGVGWWRLVGPTNRWAAFNLDYINATVHDHGLYYEFQPLLSYNGLHVMGMANAETLQVTMTDASAGIVYDTGALALGRVIREPSWWEWCFGERVTLTEYHFDDLPVQYPAAVLRIELTGHAGCRVGTILAGRSDEIGELVSFGTRLSIDDYSRRERDPWGNIYLQRRATSRRMSVTAWTPNERLDQVRRQLTDLRATVVYWEVPGHGNATRILGWPRSWDILINYPTWSQISIEIEAMAEN